MVDIIELIQSKYTSLSKGHKKIADYLLSNFDKAAFMTAEKLGKESGTSEATVVRFSYSLGFNGYGDFVKTLSDYISSSLKRKKNINHQVKISSIPDTLKLVFDKDIDNLKNTVEEFDMDSFNQAVDYILNANNIYIIGLRTAEPLANVLASYLNYIRPRVNVISSNVTSEIYEKMLHINSDDILISFGFPEYSIRTIKAMEFANVRRARIVSITDSIYSPMTMYTSCVLTAKCDLTDDIISLSSAMSLINALVLALINASKGEYYKNLEAFNDVLDNMS